MGVTQSDSPAITVGHDANVAQRDIVGLDLDASVHLDIGDNGARLVDHQWPFHHGECPGGARGLGVRVPTGVRVRRTVAERRVRGDDEGPYWWRLRARGGRGGAASAHEHDDGAQRQLPRQPKVGHREPPIVVAARERRRVGSSGVDAGLHRQSVLGSGHTEQEEQDTARHREAEPVIERQADRTPRRGRSEALGSLAEGARADPGRAQPGRDAGNHEREHGEGADDADLDEQQQVLVVEDSVAR